MIREIVLDTETTGLDPLEGHKIIEIAAIELIDHVQTKENPLLFKSRRDSGS